MGKFICFEMLEIIQKNYWDNFNIDSYYYFNYYSNLVKICSKLLYIEISNINKL